MKTYLLLAISITCVAMILLYQQFTVKRTAESDVLCLNSDSVEINSIVSDEIVKVTIIRKTDHVEEKAMSEDRGIIKGIWQWYDKIRKNIKEADTENFESKQFSQEYIFFFETSDTIIDITYSVFKEDNVAHFFLEDNGQCFEAIKPSSSLPIELKQMIFV